MVDGYKLIDNYNSNPDFDNPDADTHIISSLQASPVIARH